MGSVLIWRPVTDAHHAWQFATQAGDSLGQLIPTPPQRADGKDECEGEPRVSEEAWFKSAKSRSRVEHFQIRTLPTDGKTIGKKCRVLKMEVGFTGKGSANSIIEVLFTGKRCAISIFAVR